MKKITNILFVFAIAAFLLLGLALTIFFPKDINYYENRYCEKLIAPTTASFTDQTFQDSMENALTDQIPKAQGLKKIYNELSSTYIGTLLKPIMGNHDQTYVPYQGVMMFGGQYVNSPIVLDEVKATLDARAENYNTVMAANPDPEYYFYYIERDNDTNFETGEKTDCDDYLYARLNLEESHKQTFVIDNFEQYRSYFYKTDHHWNHIGSYKAYGEILNLLGVDSAPVEITGEHLLTEEFIGSKASTAGSSMLKEPFSVYSFDFPAMEITSNGEPITDYGTREAIIAGETMPEISYGAVYGNDDGETVFDTGNPELENLLIIGESFDNAILKLLASHFGRTHAIDLRHYERIFGQPFDLGAYAEANGIHKVLFVGSSSFYLTDTFELEVD